MKIAKQKDPSDAGNQVVQTPALRRQAVLASFLAAGIKSANRTAEKIGTTSMIFIQTPTADSQDKAETALHYHNKRKGR